MKSIMKLEPARVRMTAWSRKLRSNWTSGAIWEPYVAVAIKQTGAALGEVVLLVVVGVVITTPTSTVWLNTPLVPVTATVNDPRVADGDVLTVSVEVAGVALGVTGPGRLMETPDGADPNHE